MNWETWVPLLGFGGTLLLVLTGLLNFSVFVRQLKDAREQLETARRQLETERALEALIVAAGSDTAEKERREDLLRHYRSIEHMDPLDLARLTLQRVRADRPGTAGLALSALTQAR